MHVIRPTFARIAFSILFGVSLAASADAGECEPTWDPAVGVPGIDSGIVFDLTTHRTKAGTCPELIASGTFGSIGGVTASRIASWDGAAWHPLGDGLSNNQGYAVASYGGDVYAAGYFDSASGVAGTAKIARWDGANWQSIGAQLELFSNQLWALETWDDGTGEALYIAGNYQDIGGNTGTNFISKWDGSSFSALGTSIGGAVPLIIFDAYVWNDGTGEALYVGGRFLTIDGIPAVRIAKWDGAAWSALGTGITGPGLSPSVYSMVGFDDGSGDALYVAGQTFDNAGGVAVNRVARWDGANWSAVGDGFADGIVWALEVFDDGSGPALYAFGTFSASGATPVSRIARWNGTAWAPMGTGSDGDLYTGLGFNDGNGQALFVGGRQTAIDGTAASGLSRLIPCDDSIEGDVNDDFVINFDDLLLVLAAWGDCPEQGPCPADLNEDCTVSFDDLLLVLANWTLG